jgi:glycosyltransferase involved in cell wall biosynthesis
VNQSSAGPVVLTNLLRLHSNPFLGLWWDATRTAGARVERLRARTLARCAARGERFWVHLQFPERYATDAGAGRAALRVLKLVLLLLAARALRARVITTMHNARSHESPRPLLEAVVWSAVARATTDVHLLSSAGASEVLAQHPALRTARQHVIPQGNYRPVLGELEDRAAARQRLGFTGASRVFLLYGRLRPYKGADELLDAFGGVSDTGARLVLAGEIPDADYAAQLRAAAAADPRVRLIPGHVGERELQTLIRASDAVLLPYRKILNSGSALLALSAGRRVVLPQTPTFEQLAAAVGDGWVALLDGEVTTADLERVQPDGEPAALPDLDWCDWSVVSAGIEGLLAEGNPRGLAVERAPAN